MTLDPVKKLGRVLGSMSKDQQVTNENLTPEDVESQLQLLNSEVVEVVGSVTLTAKYYSSESFVIDHPVYGELDSSVLELDGGYDTTSENWPVSWPWSWGAGTSSSTLYTTTF